MEEGEIMKKIDKLGLVTMYETYTQPKGIYYDTNGVSYEQMEDLEMTTSYNRLPNNEEIMDKINEIIEALHETN